MCPLAPASSGRNSVVLRPGGPPRQEAEAGNQLARSAAEQNPSPSRHHLQFGHAVRGEPLFTRRPTPERRGGGPTTTAEDWTAGGTSLASYVTRLRALYAASFRLARACTLHPLARARRANPTAASKPPRPIAQRGWCIVCSPAQIPADARKGAARRSGRLGRRRDKAAYLIAVLGEHALLEGAFLEGGSTRHCQLRLHCGQPPLSRKRRAGSRKYC